MDDIVERLNAVHQNLIKLRNDTYCNTAAFEYEIESLRENVEMLEGLQMLADNDVDELKKELATLKGYKNAWVEAQRGRSAAEKELAELKGNSTVAHCSTCANLGQINGESQETYCEQCIFQRTWRQDNYVPKGRTK